MSSLFQKRIATTTKTTDTAIFAEAMPLTPIFAENGSFDIKNVSKSIDRPV